MSTTLELSAVAGRLDQELHPLTLDFIDTADGEWLESADSRSIVLCQLELELGKSITTPGDGTAIRAQLESGNPLTTAFVESECRRALAVLERQGTIGAVAVNGRDEKGGQLYDEAKRAAFLLTWTDLATGSPVDLVYRPLGG